MDPANGDVYCLLTGNRALGQPRNMLNQPRTGIYWMPRGGTKWTLLRGAVAQPAGVPDKPWCYTVSFAVDFASGTPGKRQRMFLGDLRNNLQGDGATGIWKTRWGSVSFDCECLSAVVFYAACTGVCRHCTHGNDAGASPTASRAPPLGLR